MEQGGKFEFITLDAIGAPAVFYLGLRIKNKSEIRVFKSLEEVIEAISAVKTRRKRLLFFCDNATKTFLILLNGAEILETKFDVSFFAANGNVYAFALKKRGGGLEMNFRCLSKFTTRGVREEPWFQKLTIISEKKSESRLQITERGDLSEIIRSS